MPLTFYFYFIINTHECLVDNLIRPCWLVSSFENSTCLTPSFYILERKTSRLTPLLYYNRTQNKSFLTNEQYSYHPWKIAYRNVRDIESAELLQFCHVQLRLQWLYYSEMLYLRRNTVQSVHVYRHILTIVLQYSWTNPIQFNVLASKSVWENDFTKTNFVSRLIRKLYWSGSWHIK